jgi:hypothetical protein
VIEAPERVTHLRFRVRKQRGSTELRSATKAGVMGRQLRLGRAAGVTTLASARRRSLPEGTVRHREVLARIQLANRRKQVSASRRRSLLLRTSCDSPPHTSTDCSICDGAATSPAVATLLLADKGDHARRGHLSRMPPLVRRQRDHATRGGGRMKAIVPTAASGGSRLGDSASDEPLDAIEIRTPASRRSARARGLVRAVVVTAMPAEWGSTHASTRRGKPRRMGAISVGACGAQADNQLG